MLRRDREDPLPGSRRPPLGGQAFLLLARSSSTVVAAPASRPVTPRRKRLTPSELRPDGRYVAPSQSHQDSHVLTSMLAFDAYAFVPEDRESLAAGETVDVEFVR